MEKNNILVYIAVGLIAISNAIKGTLGLYGLEGSAPNLVASIFLSVGVEVLLFYAVMRWSADRTVPAAIYASLIAVGAALLNYLFFAGHELAIPLAAVGPAVATIGGLVVGEGVRSTKEERLFSMEHELAMAKEVRLTALHDRKKAEASIKVEKKKPMKKYSTKRDHIMDIMVQKKNITPKEMVIETGYSQPYVYEVMRGANGDGNV